MNLPRYPKYKPSGVDWLGEVPEHWEVRRLKMAAALVEKKTEAAEENQLPYIGLENIEPWTGRLLPLSEDVVPSGMANLFAAGNTLFGKLRPYLAKACNPEFDGLCSTELLVLQGRETERHYLLFSLLSDGFIKQVDASTYGSKMPRANWDFIGNSRVPLPPLPEQRVIADFLDRETGRIDALVGKKRELIARLKEKRAALITRAVTRGLDPAAKLKDSGVEWLGMVPEGWEVARLGYLCSLIVDGTHFSPESDHSGDYLYITAKNIKETGFDFSNISYISAEDHAAIYSRCPVRRGDVLYIKDGATAGIAMVNTIDNEFSLLSSVALIRGRKGLLYPGFLAYYMNSGIFKNNALTTLVGGAMTRFTLEIIRRFTVVAPPYHEQRAIAEYLDRETGTLDRLTECIEAAIERLHEYRAALITAAVTGKIDVRGTQAEEAA